MNRLVDELFATGLPHGDPHGRPTYVILGGDDLDRRFGRT
jgi:DNA mismatch repair ATPase MutL